MRIVCPHAGDPHPDTVEALTRYAPDTEYVDVSSSVTAYAELVCDLWAAGTGFAIVEQDIVIRPDVTLAFLTHADPYIGFAYPWSQAIGVALGCTRFSALFTQCLPDAAEIARRIPTVYGVPGHYLQFDVWLMGAVLRDHYGWQPKTLLPPVEHRNPARACPPGTPIRMGVQGRIHLEPGLVQRIADEVAADRRVVARCAA